MSGKMRMPMRAAVFTLFAVVASSLAQAETVRIGVLAFRPKPQTQAQWQPLADSLKRKLPNYDFVVESFNYSELNAAVASQQLDFVFTNPAHYIFLKYRNGLSAPLATVIDYQLGVAVSTFGGVIFTRAGRDDVTGIEDIRGKIVAVTGNESFGGYQMQVFELALHGLNVAEEATIMQTNMPHDRVVEAVMDGRADVGFVRSGILEAMVEEGKLDPGAFKVLNAQNRADYPMRLSTRLYPEWPVVAMPNTDLELARKVTAALFTLDNDVAALTVMKIQGFSIPADYAPVENLLRLLRTPPFDDLPPVTMADLWQLYRWQIVAAALAMLAIGLLGLRLLRVNRQLKYKQTLVQQQSRRLKDSEQLWKFALEGAGDGVWDWQVQTGRAFFSRNWVEMLGFREGEFVNDVETWRNHLHPHDQNKVLPTLQAYFDGIIPAYEVEYRMRCKNGGYKWILARGMLVERTADGLPVRMVGTHADIDQRKQIQLALQDSFNLLSNLAKQIPGVIYQFRLFTDGRSCFPFASQGIEAIYEVTAEQVREDASPVFAVLHPDDMDAIMASVEESANGLLPWHHEFRVLLPKQGLRWRLGNAQPERMDDGSTLWHGFITDITERKAAEQTLQEKTEALQRSNADLEQFAYSVSHDMRQPLRMVSGHLQLLEKGLKDRLDEDNRENLLFALDGAKRMDAMIVSLLEYSRVGRKTRPKAAIASREALDDALFFLEPAIRQSNAVLDIGGIWPQLLASHDELSRLFQNLIGNALKYQESGATPNIVIDSRIDGSDWQVRICDNGIGIDPEQAGRLFQFFSRLQSRSRFEGTGMGLALCRRIVERHGGRIWVESVGEGQGSTFAFTIPIAYPATAEADSE